MAQRINALTLGLICVAAAGLFGSAAAATPSKVKVLGEARPAEAGCPADCLVEARVTGFQASIDGRKKPFSVPGNGRIVAWSIKLGRPGKADVKYFNKTFGAAKAGISILKPVRLKNGKRKLRLVKQGPTVRLAPFFGNVATFSLSKPLRVKKRHIVALTIPTWSPSFALGARKSSGWRASRVATESRGECSLDGGLANVDAGAPHVKRRTQRSYGCRYRSSRLLYSARFVAGAKGAK